MPTKNQRGLHRLPTAALKHIKGPGWHGDGGGLFLEVDPSGGKRWAMRLTVAGRRRDFGLGPLSKVSLQRARELAAEYLVQQRTACRIENRNAKWRAVGRRGSPGHRLARQPKRVEAARMKSGREHISPLASRSLEILTEARKLSPATDLIFPDLGAQCAMSENRFLVARDGLGYTKETMHAAWVPLELPRLDYGANKFPIRSCGDGAGS